MILDQKARALSTLALINVGVVIPSASAAAFGLLDSLTNDPALFVRNGTLFNGSGVAILSVADIIDTIANNSHTITADEDADADLVLDADAGGDNADTWTIRSNASGNTLTFINHTTVALTLATNGDVTLVGSLAIPANKNISCAAGTTALDLSLGTGVTKTTSGLTTVTGGLAAITQALSGAGAVNLTTLTTKLTTTDAAQALSLANGTDGQFKLITHDVDGGSAVLTPTTASGFTTITFTNAGESALLNYNTTRGWVIVALNGAVAA